MTISEAARFDGQTVTLRGWLYNLRKSGKILFPIFRDGTGLMQGVVVKSAVPEEIFNRVRDLTQESAVVVTGKIRAEARAPGGYEIDVADLVFEAPTKSAQAWFVKQFGPEVNLGNIPPDEVIPLETLRRGLRADTLKEVLLGGDGASAS